MIKILMETLKHSMRVEVSDADKVISDKYFAGENRTKTAQIHANALTSLLDWLKVGYELTEKNWWSDRNGKSADKESKTRGDN